MDQTRWGRSATPFPPHPGAAAFYESPTHDEALARLHFLVDHRCRLGLLMGPSGSGKSLLLDVFGDELRRQGRAVARADLYGAGPADLFWQLAAGLGAEGEPSDPPWRLWQALADKITAHRYQQLETVLLLDDADVASAEVLVQVGRLVRYEPLPDARLVLVLAGRRQRLGRLGMDLLDRVDLRIDVEAWGVDETREFVTRALARAGRSQPLFAEAALARLQELTGGSPRRISRLANLALVAAASRELDEIDANVVQSASEELSVVEV